MATRTDIRLRLNKLHIDPDSELGKSFTKLDNMYQVVEDTEKEIKYLIDKKIQYKEDIELMELLLMHKFNKDSREKKWDLKK